MSVYVDILLKMYQTKNRAFKQLSMKKLFLNIIEIKNSKKKKTVAKDKLATKCHEKVNKLRSSKNMNNSEKYIFGLHSE